MLQCNWQIGSIMVLLAALIMISSSAGWAGDLDDGISSYTEESISGDDSIGKKDTNISFIVVEAVAKAKAIKNKTPDGEETSSDIKSNLNDGSMETNENSVVVESGSRVDRIYNIVIEK